MTWGGKQARRQRGWQADRQTRRQIDKWTVKLKGRRTEKYTDIQMDRQTDRRTGRQTRKVRFNSQLDKRWLKHGQHMWQQKKRDIKMSQRGQSVCLLSSPLKRSVNNQLPNCLSKNICKFSYSQRKKSLILT